MRFIKGSLKRKMKIKINDTFVKSIVALLIKNDVKVMLVGGAVRNFIMQKKVHDYDLEVYDISFAKLKKLLKEFDDNMYVNDKFQTIKIKNIEIAMPRVETKTGNSYEDYNVEIITDHDYALAARRRDFTINALMYDLNEDIFYDFYHGIEDVQNSTLRYIDEKIYTEDPIRVLRLLKYQATYNLEIEPQTLRVSQKMASALADQPHTMVAQLFSDIISADYFEIWVFLAVLNDYFKIEQLKDIISDSIYHPEGSLYNHLVGTMICLSLIPPLDDKDHLVLFWALFFHDYGKLYGNEGHSAKSVEIFSEYESFLLLRLKDQELVKSLITDHMLIREYAEAADYPAMKSLLDKYKNQFHLLEIVGTCDYGGRVADFNKDALVKRMVYFQDNIVTKYEGL